MSHPSFRPREGVLFFPVTPFDAADRVDAGALAEHVAAGIRSGAGAVFPACGTGEFHALDATEYAEVLSTTVAATAGAAPVVGGAGGPLGHARRVAGAAQDAGADALLVLPPYLVTGSQRGLVDYVRAIAGSSELPVIVYHRGTAAYSPDSVRELLDDPRVIGFKDGVGDIATAQRFVLAAREAGRDDVLFFNGLLTAELSQAAYRAIGVPLYSSAVFAMAPTIATAFYRAYSSGDDERRDALLSGFFEPLVALRDRVPGYAVSLIKAGLRLRGAAVGSVRAPLTDPSPDDEAELGRILRRGEELVS